MDTNAFRLDGKVAWITGGSYGIGFAIASAYAQMGAKIVFNDLNEEKMKMGIESYKKIGIDARGFVCDVTKEDQVVALVDEVIKEFGHLDILVNNAGIIKRIPMTEMKAEEYRQVIDVDLVAPFICSKAVIPQEISALNMVLPTFSVTVSALVTSLLHRLLHSEKNSQMVPCIHSMPSSELRLQPTDGVNQKTFRVQLSSLLPTLPTSSTATSYMSMVVS